MIECSSKRCPRLASKGYKRCQPCREYNRNYSRKYREQNKIRVKETRKRCYEKRRGTKEHKKSQKAARIRHRYGISLRDYADLHIQQSGRCAICGTTNPGRSRDWNIDHDHRTGNVRGLLCCDCNQALGLFKDNVEVIRLAANYVEHYKEREKYDTKQDLQGNY